MKSLEKYFVKNFFITWLVIFLSFSLIFLSLEVNFYYARYFKYLSWLEYIYLTTFTLLNILPIIFPISFILTLGYTFGKWSSEKKLLSLKILGFSFFRLNRVFIFLAFMYSFLLLIYNLQVLPSLRKNFDSFLEIAFKKNFIYTLKENKENSLGNIKFYFKKRKQNIFFNTKLNYNNITIIAKKAEFFYKNNSLYLHLSKGTLQSKVTTFNFKQANLKLIEISKNFFSSRLKKNFIQLLKSKDFEDYFELFIRITISFSVLSVSLFILKYFYNKTLFNIVSTFKFSTGAIIGFYFLYSLFYIFSKKAFLAYLVLFPNLLFIILFLILKER